MSIVNEEYIRSHINRQAHWATSHASDEDGYIGAGLLYYSLVYMLRAELCVCIGSGGGFVPRIMKQAQRDLRLSQARTVLIDADQGDWGRPQWMDEGSFFRTTFPDVEIILDRSHNVAAGAGRDWKINYLHIDGDHSYEGSLQDYRDYKGLMAPGSIITFHDTYGEIPCYKTLHDVRADGHDVIDFREIGGGFAMIRLKS